MHIAVPIHDPCVPSLINLFHAGEAYRTWTEAFVAGTMDRADRLIAAGVVLARQPFEDEPLPTDPEEWMMDIDLHDYLAIEPCPDIYGWGPVEEKPAVADVDDEVEITEEDEAGAVLRLVEDET